MDDDAPANADVGASHGAVDADVYALARRHRDKGLGAAYCPQVAVDDRERLSDIRRAFEKEGVILAEVGGWRNMLHPDLEERQRERQRMAEFLAIADEVGALCTICVMGNPAGAKHDLHDKFNFSADGFDAAVENARWLVDTVQPKRACFVYEIYPFSVVDSPENIRALLDAVDRPQFAAHMDLVNLINCPRNYYASAALIERSVSLFGDRIVSAHAKDLAMEQEVSVIQREVRPGLGNVDYGAYLRALHGLPQVVPLMLEHLPSQAEYDLGADYIRRVAAGEDIPLE